MKIRALVDPETGNIIGLEKPWWAFLASETDEDVSDAEQELEDETETDINVTGGANISFSSNIGDALDKLISNISGSEEEIKIRLRVIKKDNMTSVKAEIKEGSLTEEQQALLDNLENEIKAFIDNSGIKSIKFDIEIRQKLKKKVEKAIICHISDDTNSTRTIIVGSPAVKAHLAHGDSLGACAKENDTDDEDNENEINETDDDTEDNLNNTAINNTNITG